MNYFVTLKPTAEFEFDTIIRPYVPGYEATKEQVEGWIESVYAWTLFPRDGLDDLRTWVNEEGLLLQGLKPCLLMFGPGKRVQPIFGNVVFDYIDEVGVSHGLNAEQVCRVLDAIERSPYKTEFKFIDCNRDNIIYDSHPKDKTKTVKKNAS